MKARRSFWRFIVGDDWRVKFRMWLPLFLLAIWFGARQGFEDMGLFILAMAVCIWLVCDHAVLAYRKWQEWRVQARSRRAQKGDEFGGREWGR